MFRDALMLALFVENAAVRYLDAAYMSEYGTYVGPRIRNGICSLDKAGLVLIRCVFNWWQAGREVKSTCKYLDEFRNKM